MNALLQREAEFAGPMQSYFNNVDCNLVGMESSAVEEDILVMFLAIFELFWPAHVVHHI